MATTLYNPVQPSSSPRSGSGIDRVFIGNNSPRKSLGQLFSPYGITNYLENDGDLENAQAIAAHEDVRTTKLYDRTGDILSMDEIEKISL
jgi:hypothetical protein